MDCDRRCTAVASAGGLPAAQDGLAMHDACMRWQLRRQAYCSGCCSELGLQEYAAITCSHACVHATTQPTSCYCSAAAATCCGYLQLPAQRCTHILRGTSGGLKGSLVKTSVVASTAAAAAAAAPAAPCCCGACGCAIAQLPAAEASAAATVSEAAAASAAVDLLGSSCCSVRSCGVAAVLPLLGFLVGALQVCGAAAEQVQLPPCLLATASKRPCSPLWGCT